MKLINTVFLNRFHLFQQQDFDDKREKFEQSQQAFLLNNYPDSASFYNAKVKEDLTQANKTRPNTRQDSRERLGRGSCAQSAPIKQGRIHGYRSRVRVAGAVIKQAFQAIGREQ